MSKKYKVVYRPQENSKAVEVKKDEVITDDDRKEKSKKLLKARGVWWFAESYISEDRIKLACEKADHWAYIYHDQDDAEPHYHILLHYENARSGCAVLKDFVGWGNTLVQPVKSHPSACYEYLTHKNDPDKYQYNDDRVITHNPVYWEHFLPCIRDRNEVDFIEDLLNTKDFNLYDMAKKYGRDFMKNWRSYKDFRDECLWQRRYEHSE